MKTLRQNARYSIRLLRKNPGFTLIASKAAKVDPMVALRYE